MNQHPSHAIAEVVVITGEEDEVMPHCVDGLTWGQGALGDCCQIEETLQVLKDFGSMLGGPSMFVHHAVEEWVELVSEDRGLTVWLETKFLADPQDAPLLVATSCLTAVSATD